MSLANQINIEMLHVGSVPTSCPSDVWTQTQCIHSPELVENHNNADLCLAKMKKKKAQLLKNEHNSCC